MFLFRDISSRYLSWARNDLRKICSGVSHHWQTGARDHVAAADAVNASLHTPAQAHLMANACPLDMKREPKLRAAPAVHDTAATSAVTIISAAAQKRTAAGGRSQASAPLAADTATKRPRRSAVSGCVEEVGGRQPRRRPASGGCAAGPKCKK